MEVFGVLTILKVEHCFARLETDLSLVGLSLWKKYTLTSNGELFSKEGGHLYQRRKALKSHRRRLLEDLELFECIPLDLNSCPGHKLQDDE